MNLIFYHYRANGRILVAMARKSRSSFPPSLGAGTRIEATRSIEQVMSSVWIVVPAYNEQPTIRQAVFGLRQFCPNIAVVDDFSADLTSIFARSAGASVLRHPINLGQGAALQTGIEFALQNGASHVVTFDADLQHHPEDVPLLIRALTVTGADFALGSRFLGTATNIGSARKLVLKAAVLFTRLTTGLRLTDVHNGLRAMTRRGATVMQIRQNRMAHASEILQQIAKSGLPYVEVPVTVEYTSYSTAKGQRLSNSLNIVLELLSRALQG
jgi:glycosyltransferase involved in cell wall biosynthesis